MGKSTSRRAVQGLPSRSDKPVHTLPLPGSGESERRPCWRFSHVDHDGPWGFAEVKPAELCQILRCLASFETMTLNEIFHSGGYPGKDYDVATIPNREALQRLEEMGLADQTKIWALRLQGEPRLYGFLDENIFHVVWWDPKHEVWPSRKKHT
jgi:hypothetical protein